MPSRHAFLFGVLAGLALICGVHATTRSDSTGQVQMTRVYLDGNTLTGLGTSREPLRMSASYAPESGSLIAGRFTQQDFAAWVRDGHVGAFCARYFRHNAICDTNWIDGLSLIQGPEGVGGCPRLAVVEALHTSSFMPSMCTNDEVQQILLSIIAESYVNGTSESDGSSR